MRHTLGWASITLVVGAVGCGGTAFVATTGDAGDDATMQGDTGVKGPDAGHHADAGVDGHHEGTDAKKPVEGGEKKDTGIDAPVVTPDGGVDAEVDASGGKDAGEDTAAPVDAGHDVGVDAGPPPCRVADSMNGVFASPTGAASPCGTFQTPCSITEAISVAQTAGKAFVYLAPSATADGGPGKYELPSGVTLMTNVSLVGGWIVKPTGWTANCDPNANTTTVLSSTNSVAVTAMGVTGVALDTLTIENVATAGTGESLYGIFATGSTLTLNDVIIQVAAGGTGAAGSASAMTGTTGGGSCSVAMGSGTGAVGSVGPAGSFSASGWTVAAAGTGSPGTPGGQGTTGTSGPCVNASTACAHAAGSTTICQENAKSEICGTGGAGGCGGGGGAGGAGGSGGGSSVGIFTLNTSVTAKGGSIAAGAGGIGGGGGAGAGGGLGVIGKPGAPSAEKPLLTCVDGNPCASTFGPAEGAGGTGGVGTTGGTGGQGGGGAGGASYAYATSGTGTVTLTSTLTSFVTPAATGGPPNGAPGPAATHN